MNPWLAAAIIVGALVVSVVLGWLAAVGVLRLAKVPEVIKPQLERDASGRLVPVLKNPETPPRPLLRGGLWIGILERLAVTGLIMLDQPGLVALVVAIKGLGRYPELQQSNAASERFIVGTFASLIVALAAGFGARALLP